MLSKYYKENPCIFLSMWFLSYSKWIFQTSPSSWANSSSFRDVIKNPSTSVWQFESFKKQMLRQTMKYERFFRGNTCSGLRGKGAGISEESSQTMIQVQKGRYKEEGLGRKRQNLKCSSERILIRPWKLQSKYCPSEESCDVQELTSSSTLIQSLGAFWK